MTCGAIINGVTKHNTNALRRLTSVSVTRTATRVPRTTARIVPPKPTMSVLPAAIHVARDERPLVIAAVERAPPGATISPSNRSGQNGKQDDESDNRCRQGPFRAPAFFQLTDIVGS